MGKVKSYYQEEQEYLQEQEEAVALSDPSLYYKAREEKEEEVMLADLSFDELARYSFGGGNTRKRTPEEMKELDKYLDSEIAKIDQMFAVKKDSQGLKGATLRERLINISRGEK